MPSVDELNAGFDAIQPDLRQIIQSFVPAFFQSQAMQSVQSEQGRAIIVDGVRRVLVAAEAVRNRPQKASSPR